MKRPQEKEYETEIRVKKKESYLTSRQTDMHQSKKENTLKQDRF